MKIRIGQIEGKTNKKGSKQNKIYTVKQAFEAEDLKNWFVSDCGKTQIWNVNGDWSKVGVMKTGGRRCSYTTDFEIIEN